MNMKVLRFKKGQSLVEFALLLPLLLGIVFIIVDFGRVIYYYTTIYNAAREAARAGIVNKDITVDGLKTAAASKLVGVDPGSLIFTGTEIQKTTRPYYIYVKIQYNFTPVTPIGAFLGSDGKINLTTTSQMRTEW